jgi:hypothetical protein
MTMKWIGAVLLLAAVVPPLSAATDQKVDDELLNGTRPFVRVLSPQSPAFVMRPGGEQRLLILLEIVAVNGSDIVVDDHGLPRFVEPNHNVDLFDSYVVSHKEYVNSLGQTVLQFASEIPVEALRAGDYSMSPPINYRGLDKAQRERGLAIPVQAMVSDVIEFYFQVKDKEGNVSDPKGAHAFLLVGMASEVYQPPPPPLGPDGKPLVPAPNEKDAAPGSRPEDRKNGSPNS